MRCNEYRNNLHEYAKGKLCELESRATAKHLKTCDECRKELEEIKELKALLMSGFQESMMPPMDLKSSIMASINLKKYKKANKNNWGELANWGMSLVAAGLILLLINVTPMENILRAQNEWDDTKENITQKIYQPFSSINERLDKLTERVTQLDGITGRIEKGKEGGN